MRVGDCTDWRVEWREEMELKLQIPCLTDFLVTLRVHASSVAKTVVGAGLDVYAHNIETVERLQGAVRDRRAGWAQSLGTLAAAKAAGARLTKSSIMLGCGESQGEVVAALRALRDHGVDVVTLGQYMRPTKKHMSVSEYVTPEAFEAYKRIADDMGFTYCASGPMVRSSYRAGEMYITNVLKGGGSSSKAAGGDVQQAQAQ